MNRIVYKMLAANMSGKTDIRYKRMRLCINVKILSFILISFSLDGVRADSFEFLKQYYSPRIAALAGANTTLIGDVTGIFINPAGLAYINHHQVTLNYIDHLLDFKAGMLGYTYPTKRWGNLSVGIIYFDYGDFEEIDKYGLVTGRNLSAKDATFAVSYAYLINDRLAVGSNIKLIYSTMDQYNAAAVATDLGILYRPHFLDGTSVGFTLLHSGSNFNPYHETKEQLPLIMKLGASYRFTLIPLTLHASMNYAVEEKDYYNRSPFTFSLGSEYTIFEKIAIRIGYDYRKHLDLCIPENRVLTGFSAGVGIQLENNSLDYALNDHGPLGLVHRFGVTFHFKAQGLLRETGVTETVPIPQNLTAELTEDFITLSWKGGKNVFYNVYARYSGQAEWTKINIRPLSRRGIRFKRPKTRGIYFFAIKALEQDRESEFSVPVSIVVE